MTNQNAKLVATPILSLRGTIVRKQYRGGQAIATHLSGAPNDIADMKA